MSSPSTVVYDFAVELVDAALPAAALEDDGNIEVLDSQFQAITKDRGIVVSNSEWDFAPAGEIVKFYDSLVIVGFYLRIAGIDTTERKAARDAVFEMAREFSAAIYADQTLGGRVCDCQILRSVNGDNSTTSDSYSIINLPLILNPTGAAVDDRLGDAR